MSASSYRGARALVLGAGGFLGRWVARELAARGATTALCARDARAVERLRGPWGLAGEVLEADLSLEGEAGRVVREARPQVVFNLAGYGIDRAERDEELAAALNARLPAELAQAVASHRDAAWSGLALVHAGSALEYGTLDTHLGEDEEERPTTVYGRTKLAGTRALLAAARVGDLRATVARLFTVYGPGEHAGRLLPSLLAAAESGASVPLSEGSQQRDFTYVEDVVEGLLRLGLSSAEVLPTSSVLNLATGELTSVREFALRAAVVLGIAPERLRFGALPSRSDDMRHRCVSVARSRAALGWVPATSIAAGVRRTADLERALSKGGP